MSSFSAAWLALREPATSRRVRRSRRGGSTRRCRTAGHRDDPGIFTGRALVTASAFLDLVSARWLAPWRIDVVRVAQRRCLRSRTTVGFVVFPKTRKTSIRGLVNRHQRTDKGFGEALGPEATDHAERYFSGVGYAVRCEPSDWVLPSQARGLQRALIDGWAEAAVAIAPDQITVIRGWQTRRLAHVAANRSQLTVGHQDLAAWVAASCRFHVRSYDQDLSDLAPDGIDLVVAIESLAHAADPARSVGNFSRALASGGVLAIVDDFPAPALADDDPDFVAFREG